MTDPVRSHDTTLCELARRIGQAEKSRDAEFFEALLAEKLTFRRAKQKYKPHQHSSMNIDTDKKGLQTLNEEIATRESQRDDASKKWFGDLLSEQLIFRRADTTIVDKTGFLIGLDKSDLFVFRKAEDINATVIGDRALVTLIVHTKKNDGSEQRYRNIRLFSRSGENWVMEFWYNYEITSL